MSRRLIVLFAFFWAYPIVSFAPACIPVMGFGFIDDVMSFIPRLIHSIDHCVEHLIVVGSETKRSEYLLQLHENLTYLPQKYQLIGVAEGWNMILQSYPTSPWYLITAYDVEFLPGQLLELNQRFWYESQLPTHDPRYTNFAHTKWQNLPGGKGFNLFAISQAVIKHCGYFDENIFPAFWEDRDYQYRMKLWPSSSIKTYKTIRPWHGEHATGDKARLTSESKPKYLFNYTSGTVYLKKEWSKIMKMTSTWNINYVTKKWGCDLDAALQRHHLLNCTYTRPFNQPSAAIGDWKGSPERIKMMKMEYERLLGQH